MSELQLFGAGAALPANKFDEQFDKVASGGGFLPRLMLYGSNSDVVKDEKAQVGYSLVKGKDELTYIGKEVEVLVLSWRPKALDMSGEQVVANHNPESPAFKAIAYRADNEKDSGCMFGPEYLVWIPALKCFATFLMGSKTARREAPAVKGFLPKPGQPLKVCQLTTKLYSNDRFKWHGPKALESSVPVEMPDGPEAIDQIEKFQNPPESSVEAVEPEATGGGRDR